MSDQNPVNEAIQAAGVIAAGATETIRRLREEIQEMRHRQRRVHLPPCVEAWFKKYEDCEGLPGVPCALRYLGSKGRDGQDSEEWYHFACGAHTDQEGYYDETGHPDYRKAECFVDTWVSADNGGVSDVG